MHSSSYHTRYYDTRPGGRHSIPLEQTATGMPTSYQATATAMPDITKRDNTIYLRTVINGKTIYVLYDTGAPHSIISKADAAKIGIPTTADQMQRVTMKIGTSTFQTQMEVAGFLDTHGYDITVISSSDLRKSGYNIIGDRLVKRGTVIPATAVAQSLSRPTKTIKLQRGTGGHSEHLFVNVKINGRPTKIIFDTGASSTWLYRPDVPGVTSNRLRLQIGDSQPFWTDVSFYEGDGISVLSLRDVEKAGYTFTGDSFVPKGARIVAPALTT